MRRINLQSPTKQELRKQVPSKYASHCMPLYMLFLLFILLHIISSLNQNQLTIEYLPFTQPLSCGYSLSHKITHCARDFLY